MSTKSTKQTEELLAVGKRGEVYRTHNNTVIKRLRPGTAAKNAITMEAHYLQKANELGLGPKFIRADENEIEMEYVEGMRIDKFLESAQAKQKIIVVKKIIMQLQKLDAAGINKKEMTHPYKHIIIRRGKPVLIDWERARFTKRPNNVAQFSVYLVRHGLLPKTHE